MKGSYPPFTVTKQPEAYSTTATLTPAKKLRAGAIYIATVTTAATDESGNPLDQNTLTAGNQPNTWKFTVRG
jgi:Bacterial Ig-like domain